MKRLLLLPFLFVTILASAQEPVEMADTMRAEGKIYVVVVMASIVLAGLLLYVFSIDRKVSKLEKKLPDSRR